MLNTAKDAQLLSWEGELFAHWNEYSTNSQSDMGVGWLNISRIGNLFTHKSTHQHTMHNIWEGADKYHSIRYRQHLNFSRQME